MSFINIAFAGLVAAWLVTFAAGCRIGRGLHLALGWGASALALVAGGAAVLNGTTVSATLGQLSILGSLSVTLTPLRGFFIVIAAGVYAATLPFAVAESRLYSARRTTAFLMLYTLLFATLLAVLIAADVVSFVLAWELMSLALWALVSFHTRAVRTRGASFMTIVFSEAGALAGLVGLLLLAAAAGSTDLGVIGERAASLPPAIRWIGFLLTFYGFGVKTGIAPVNTWMVQGYAAAPPAVRALFSGATLNLGVFALWTIDAPLAIHAPWMAVVVLVTGAVTALLGIVYAMVARDLVRLLTESSIENLGIVVAASGAGFAFVALGRPVLGGIALVAGLYHMLNHSAYKTLLFLGAGAIERATGTGTLDRLGGLLRRLPTLGALFLVGAFAIAALPPFNGFVSEWLTLESLLRVVEIDAVPVRIAFAFSGALLALTAGLALTCFVMLAGSTLLGIPRSLAAARPRPAAASAVWPMAVLAVVCLALGVLATAVIPLLGGLAQPLAGTDPTPALVPAFFQWTATAAHGVSTDLVQALTPIGAQLGRGLVPLRGLVVLHSGGAPTPVVFAMSTALSCGVIVVLLAVVWLATRGLRRRPVRRARPWEAGLHRLRPEMTYTATAFASPVRVLFETVLRPAVAEHTERHGAFTTSVRRQVQIVHVIDRLTVRPLLDRGAALSGWLARMHRGHVTVYAAYILTVLVALLLVARLLPG